MMAVVFMIGNPLLKSLFSALALAGVAAAENFVSVPERSKMQGFAGLFLNALHLRPLDFADAAAFDTDQVIVVRPLIFDLKLGLTGGRGDALGQPALFQHLQRPEDRDFADAFALERLVNVIHGHVLIGMQQEIHDLHPLLRMPQALLREVFLKNLMNPGDIPLPSCRPGGKENELFGGDGDHGLLKSAFNIRTWRAQVKESTL
jgi:hypothetical protein